MGGYGGRYYFQCSITEAEAKLHIPIKGVVAEKYPTHKISEDKHAPATAPLNEGRMQRALQVW